MDLGISFNVNYQVLLQPISSSPQTPIDVRMKMYKLMSLFSPREGESLLHVRPWVNIKLKKHNVTRNVNPINQSRWIGWKTSWSYSSKVFWKNHACRTSSVLLLFVDFFSNAGIFLTYMILFGHICLVFYRYVRYCFGSWCFSCWFSCETLLCEGVNGWHKTSWLKSEYCSMVNEMLYTNHLTYLNLT